METGGKWFEAVSTAFELFDFPEPPDMGPELPTYSVREAIDEIAKGQDQGLLKYKRVRDQKWRACTPQLTLGLNMYITLLKQLASWIPVRALLRKHKVEDWAKRENWREGFSWISNVMKKTGAFYGEYLVDLATLNGYDGGLTDEEIKEGVRDWCGIRKERGEGEEWLKGLRREVRRFIQGRLVEKGWKEEVSQVEYAHNPVIWGTTGSVLYDRKRKLKGHDDSGLVSAKNSKWAAAAVIPPSEVLHALRTRARGYAKAIVKRETKKSRLVIAANIEGYWQQDWLSTTALDNLLSGSEVSTLWMNSSQTSRFWEQARTQSGRVFLPLDQSEFDRNQTREMIVEVMAGVREALQDWASEDWLSTYDRAVYGMLNGYVLAAGEKIPYKNGVLSGWRWTAMLDTLLNMAVTRLAEYYTRSYSAGNVYQGDDVYGVYSSFTDAKLVWEKIQEWGFSVNPLKFFCSKARSEFLRRYVRDQRVAGYPARTINAILWRNPIKNVTPPGLERLAERLSLWELWCARTNSWDLPKETVQDLALANEFSSDFVEQWLNTPKAWGGGGNGLTSQTGFVVETSKRTEPVRLPPAAPGVDATIKSLDDLGYPGKSGMVRRWWQGVVVWNRNEWTRAGHGTVKVRANISTRNLGAPRSSYSHGLSLLQRLYMNLFPEIAKADVPVDWWPGAQSSIRVDTWLGRQPFSHVSVRGIDAGWLGAMAGNRLQDALGTLYSLRIRNDTAVAQIKAGLETQAYFTARSLFNKFQYVCA